MTVCSPDLKEERRLRREGHEWVAGLDEVGRGAWAGPLTVGVAVLRPRVTTRSMPAWLRDSKMLSEAKREQIFDKVGAWCEAWAVGHSTPGRVRRMGHDRGAAGGRPAGPVRPGPGTRSPHRRRSARPAAPPRRSLQRRRPPHRPRRRQVRLGGGRLGAGQGGARPHHARGGRQLSGLRLRTEQGLPVAGPSDGAAGLRAYRHPPLQLGLRPGPALARVGPAGQTTVETSAKWQATG